MFGVMVLSDLFLNIYYRECDSIAKNLSEVRSKLLSNSKEPPNGIVEKNLRESSLIDTTKKLTAVLSDEKGRIVSITCNYLKQIKKRIDDLCRDFNNVESGIRKLRNMNDIWIGLGADIEQSLCLLDVDNVKKSNWIWGNVEFDISKKTLDALIVSEREHHEILYAMLSEINQEARVRLNSQNSSDIVKKELQKIIIAINKRKDERESILSDALKLLHALSEASDDVTNYHTEKETINLGMTTQSSEAYFRKSAKQYKELMNIVKLLIQLLVCQRG